MRQLPGYADIIAELSAQQLTLIIVIMDLLRINLLLWKELVRSIMIRMARRVRKIKMVILSDAASSFDVNNF